MTARLVPIQEGLIVVLTRQSREEYYGNVSTKIQTEDMVEHAKKLVVDPDRQVLLIDENLQEDGSIKSVSGTWGVDKRKGLAAMYEAFANGYNGQRVKLVLSFAEDRMFRDDTALEVNNYIQIALTYSVQTKIYQSGKIYNFKNPWDKKEFRLKCEWAADELNVKILGRMLGARERMLERGEYSNLGRLSLGLVRDNNKLDEEGKPNKYYRKTVPYPPHAEVIKRLFDGYYEMGLARKLYNQEVKGRYIFPPLEPGMYNLYGPAFDERGAKISYSGLRSILTNPMYIGWWFDRVNGVWLKDNHPAIVEESVFWYAFNRLSPILLDGTPNPNRLRTRERAPSDATPTKDDSGILKEYLAPLRKGWHTHTRRRKGVVLYELFDYEDPGERKTLLSLSAKEVDSVFLGLLKEKLGNDGELATFKKAEEKALAEQKGKVTAREVELQGIEDQMREIEEKIDALKNVKLIGRLEEKYSALEAKKDALLNTPVEQINKKQRKRYDYYTLLEKLGPHLERLTHEERRVLVEGTITEVRIDPLSRSFYKLVVEWYAWGTEVYAVHRRHGGSPEFTDEENEIVRRLYPTAPIEEIVRALPSKSWEGIKLRAFTMGIRRERNARCKDMRVHKYAQEDIIVMDEYGLTPESKVINITIRDADRDQHPDDYNGYESP